MIRHLRVPAGIVALATMCIAFAPVAQSAEKVSIAYSQTLYSAEVIIAKEKGYFAKHGIEMEPKLFTSGKLTLDAVLADAVDMCTTAETPITAAAMADRPFAIVARIATASSSTLVNAASGIKSVRDLKGKKLAITAGTGSEVYTYTLLAKVGLKPSDVTLVNMPPEDMPGALANGSVDAINTWQPNISNAERLLGPKAKLLNTQGVYHETWNLVVLRTTLAKRSKAITSTIEALLDAERFIRAHHAEAVEILSRVIGIKPNVINDSWNNFEFRVVLNNDLLKTLDAESRWRLATGNAPQGVTSVPDFKKWIAPGPLRAADPARVSLSGM